MIEWELDNHLGSPQTSGSERRYNCPLCIEVKGSPDTKQHLYINIDKNVYNCFRCDSKGSLRYLCKKLGIEWDEGPKETKWSEWSKIKDMFSQENKILSINYPCDVRIPIKGSDAFSYLQIRGLTDQQISYYKIRWAHYKGADRIFVPFFNSIGEMVYWVARAFYNYTDSNAVKYVNPGVGHKTIFNFYRQSGKESIIIVEGVFDAISVGYNAVAVLGKTLSKWQLDLLLSKDFQEYIIALDSDAKEASIKMANKFLSCGRNVSIVSLPDGLDPALDKNFKDRLESRKAWRYQDSVKQRLGEIFYG